MTQELTAKAVVLSGRRMVTDVCQQALRTHQITGDDFFVSADKAAVINKLVAAGPYIVIIDWEVGVESALDVLQFVHSSGQSEIWPIYVITADLNEKIIAAGAEFGATKVHTGDLSAGNAKVAIDQLVEQLKQVTPMRKLMQSVVNNLQEENWAEAGDLLEKIRASDPENEKALLLLADCYTRQGRWKEAQMLLQPFESAEKQNAKALHILGKCYLHANQDEKACEILQQAKIVNPFNVERLVELGNTLLGLDRVEEAKENFSDAMAIAPDSPEANKGMGRGMLMDGEVNEALELLSGSFSGRELASVFNTAAVMLIRLEKHDQALNLYGSAEKALQDQGSDTLARVLYNKGIGLFKLSRFQESLDAFEAAANLDPSFTNAVHNADVLAKKVKSQADGLPDAPATGAKDTPAVAAAEHTAVALDKEATDAIDSVFDEFLDQEDEHF